VPSETGLLALTPGKGLGRRLPVHNVFMSEPAIGHNMLSDLQDELRYLLNHWDPIGIYDEVNDNPPDEYDCLIDRS